MLKYCHIFCIIGRMEKATVSITLVERSTGSGMLVILIVQVLNLLCTTLKTPEP